MTVETNLAQGLVAAACPLEAPVVTRHKHCRLLQALAQQPCPLQALEVAW